MLKIAICDDDLSFAGKIETLILQESQRMNLRVETEVFSDGKTLVNNVHAGRPYHIIFLDIKMKHMDGLSAARHIRDLNEFVLLIFISGYDSYFQDLFEVEPFRFLFKPLDEQRFHRYFADACQRLNTATFFYQYTFNKEIHKVYLKDIAYFESRKRIIYIFLKDGSSVHFYGKLNEVEKNLTDSKELFLRIHQSYLVNYSYITEMNYINVIIRFSGKTVELKVSEDRKQKVRRQLCDMAGSKTVIE